MKDLWDFKDLTIHVNHLSHLKTFSERGENNTNCVNDSFIRVKAGTVLCAPHSLERSGGADACMPDGQIL
jgi:hypothetical protein